MCVCVVYGINESRVTTESPKESYNKEAHTMEKSIISAVGTNAF